MATYTEHYGLHQWEPEDDFLRTDFNTDFGKIDAAIKGVETDANGKLAQKAEVVVGGYTGNGTTQTITLGFKPKFVLVPIYEDKCAATLDNGTNYMIVVTEGGFEVTYAKSFSYTPNTSGTSYRYIAIK